MHVQLVKEKCKRSVARLPLQVLQKVLEVVLVCDLGVDVKETEAVLFGHGCDHSSEALINFLLVNSQVCVLSTPLFGLKGQFGKDDLVAIDDLSSRRFLVVYLCENGAALFLIACSQRRRHKFFLPNFFSSYAVAKVKSAKARHCDPLVSELSMKPHSSLF